MGEHPPFGVRWGRLVRFRTVTDLDPPPTVLCAVVPTLHDTSQSVLCVCSVLCCARVACVTVCAYVLVCVMLVCVFTECADILVIFLVCDGEKSLFMRVISPSIFLTFLAHLCYNALYIQSKDWIQL